MKSNISLHKKHDYTGSVHIVTPPYYVYLLIQPLPLKYHTQMNNDKTFRIDFEMAILHSFARVNDSAFALFEERWPSAIKLVASNTCRILVQNETARKIELGIYVTQMDANDQQKLTRYLVNFSSHRFTKWLEIVLEKYLNHLPEFTSEWIDNTSFAARLYHKYGMRIAAVINHLDGSDDSLAEGDVYPIKFIIKKEQ